MKANRVSLYVLSFLCVICGLTQVVHAETVYVIIEHAAPSTLKAYEIDGNQLEEYPNGSGIIDVSDLLVYQGYGAVGVAVWPDIETAFFTYEQSNDIAMASTKTLEGKGVFDTDIINISGLAGIAIDEEKEKVYVLTRSNDELYVYTWDAANETLVLEHPNDPCNPDRLYHPLASLGNAGYGIALDETNDLLYATNGTSTVRYYNTTTWELVGSIDTGRVAVGIAIDYENEYMYTGGYSNTSPHNFLIKTDLSDPNLIIEKDIGAIAVGLAVDQTTGLVYTTKINYAQSLYQVAVYDTSGWISDPNQIVDPNDYETAGVSGPAGIAIGSQYKPPIMGLDVTPDPCTCVYPIGQGDPCYVEYTICYSGGEQGNQTNTWLTAYLPWEVYPTDPCDENYFWEDHVFMWSLGTVAEDANDCVSFEVYVNDLAEPLGSFDIRVELESDASYTTETITTDVCCWGGDIIYVNEVADSFQVA